MAEDLPLLGHVPRLSAGSTERKVDEHEAGDAAVLDNVASRADDDGRQAMLFKVTGNMTMASSLSSCAKRKAFGASCPSTFF
ncbi:MAG: hypothetical protein JSS20_01745 [Proteobacteria bacterium]|nr:hypothetical protein [Pseudomonadota bacterium]